MRPTLLILALAVMLAAAFALGRATAPRPPPIVITEPPPVAAPALHASAAPHPKKHTAKDEDD